MVVHGIARGSRYALSFLVLELFLSIVPGRTWAQEELEEVDGPAVATFGGWSALPGGGATSSGPEVVTFNGEPWVFVRGTDDHIYQNRLTGGNWTGWSEVPGGGLTVGEPSAAVFNGELYLFVRGSSNRFIYLNRLTASGWTGWGEVPGGGTTPSEPEAVVFNNELHLYVRGHPDNKIYTNRLSAGSWTGWSEVPGGGLTDDAPEGEVFESTLYLFVRGTDNHVYDNLLTVNGVWSGWALVPSSTITRNTGADPEAVVFNGELCIFIQITGGAATGNRIYQNCLTPGASGSWSGWIEVGGGGRTPSGPGAAVAGSTLYLIVRGTDDAIYLNQSPAGTAVLEE
jgi:hypothetical protein